MEQIVLDVDGHQLARQGGADGEDLVGDEAGVQTNMAWRFRTPSGDLVEGSTSADLEGEWLRVNLSGVESELVLSYSGYFPACDCVSPTYTVSQPK